MLSSHYQKRILFIVFHSSFIHWECLSLPNLKMEYLNLPQLTGMIP